MPQNLPSSGDLSVGPFLCEIFEKYKHLHKGHHSTTLHKKKMRSNRISKESKSQVDELSSSNDLTSKWIFFPLATLIVYIQSILDRYESGYPGDVISPFGA